MASESLGPVDSTESLQGIYDTACKEFTERYGAPTLNNLLWDAGLAGSNDLNAQILTLKYYDEAYCDDLVGDDGKQLQPIIPDPTAAYEETKRSYEQTSREFAATYGDMKEAELLSASGLDVGTDYESKEQVLKNYADANPVSSDDDSDDTLRLSTEFPFLLASGTETISGKYNGVDNYIYYDPTKTAAACMALLDYKEEFIDSFESIIEFDKFYSYLKSPYSDYVKNKTNYNSADTVLGKITTDLNDKMVSVKGTIEEIINAILAYSRNDFTGIDKLLGSGPFGGGPGGDDGDGDDYFEDLDTPLDDINDEIENLGEDITTGGTSNTDDSKLSDDEKLVIPGYENRASSVIGAALSSTLDSSDELLKLGEDVTSNDSLAGSLFNSDGKFLIPSFGAKNMVGESSGVKKSGIAVGGAVIAAASMALGGKVIYDKKNEANDEIKSTADTDDTVADIDDSVDNDSEETDNTNEEDTKSSDEKDNVFGKSVVKFKETLFDENDGSDIND